MSTTGPFNASTRSAINVLTSTMTDLGLDLPAHLTTEFATIEAATKIPGSLVPNAQQAARRWYDLARDGKVPAKDKEVLDLLSRSRDNVRGLELSLATIAEEATATALANAADGIIETMQDVVVQAQETIEEARAKIGSTVIETRVSGLSLENKRQHDAAQDAFTRTGLAKRIWTLLANYTGRATWRPGRVEELLILANLNLDALDQIGQRVSHARNRGGVTSAAVYQLDARTLTEFGHRLDLADFDTFRARQLRIAVETKRQADASQQRPKVTDGIDPTRLREAQV